MQELQITNRDLECGSRPDRERNEHGEQMVPGDYTALIDLKIRRSK
jgi:hypothetical protein